MIEVRKYIPQVYNQSRDFSVFMGVLQIALNELDTKSFSLKSIPTCNLVFPRCQSILSIKSDFKNLLKNRGSIMAILYSVSLAGGELITFEEESRRLSEKAQTISEEIVNNLLEDDDLIIRDKSKLEELEIDLNKLVYYRDGQIIYINIKDLSLVNKGLLDGLFYYVKPANIAIVLNQLNY